MQSSRLVQHAVRRRASAGPASTLPRRRTFFSVPDQQLHISRTLPWIFYTYHGRVYEWCVITDLRVLLLPKFLPPCNQILSETAIRSGLWCERVSPLSSVLHVITHDFSTSTWVRAWCAIQDGAYRWLHGRRAELYQWCLLHTEWASESMYLHHLLPP